MSPRNAMEQFTSGITGAVRRAGIKHGRQGVRKLSPVFGSGLAALLLAASTLAGAHAGESEAAADFHSYCSPCHGLEARGDGPVAPVLKTQPADLTRIAERNGGTFPADEIYRKIEGLDMPAAHGSSEMPVWGLWFTNQAVGESVLVEDAKPAEQRVRERITALVDYLKTLQE